MIQSPSRRPRPSEGHARGCGAVRGRVDSRIPVATVGYGPLLEPDVAEAAGVAAEPFWRARGLSPPRWAGLYRELYVDPCPPSLQIAAIEELPALQKMGQAAP